MKKNLKSKNISNYRCNCVLSMTTPTSWCNNLMPLQILMTPLQLIAE